MISNENDDLRERIQVMEEINENDQVYDIQRLVKEKRILEKRIIKLEQSGSNWNRQSIKNQMSSLSK